MGKQAREARRQSPRGLRPMRLVSLGHPALTAVALQEPPGPEVHELGLRLVATARHHRGLAVAAPQVGHQVALVGCASGLIILNPTLANPVGTQVGSEGCLSLPNRWFTVKRANRITVCGIDPLSGDPVSVDEAELLARLWQHEVDHLDGILISERWPEIIETEA